MSDLKRSAKPEMLPRRIIGYALPVLGLVLSRILYNPNAGDHRPAAWLLPIGCALGALLMIPEIKKEDEGRSAFAIIYGFLSLLAALGLAAFYIVFNGWMHGF
jgi:hypothetical protein